VAVSFTFCGAVTAEMVAEKLALLAPEATVTEAGTDTAPLLLESPTLNPALGADAVSVTVQLSVPAPNIEELVQLKLDREAVPEFEPLPCSLIVLESVVVLVLLMVVMVNCAVESVVVLGLKRTCASSVWPGVRVAGNEVVFTVKALLEEVNSLTCSGVVPWFMIAMLFDAPDPTVTSAKSTLVGVTNSGALFDVGDEKAAAWEPQPEIPRPIAREPKAIMAIAIRPKMFGLA
jgi:hypothetical protein